MTSEDSLRLKTGLKVRKRLKSEFWEASMMVGERERLCLCETETESGCESRTRENGVDI